ncbi:MAG: outer membrane protein assembly factor BamC [Gallionella sp.]|nr:outer membrane protein assembly factor BamC [Gallionella sp.]
MKVLPIGMFSIALVLLAGCNATGLGNKRIDYRTGAEQAPTLEVPPDLTAPGSDERYRVPQGDEETVATFSDYSKGGAATRRNANAVLPEVKNVRLERNGTQRWLTVRDKPENVWAVVRSFWQENGLAIKSENQAAGVMETDWAENRANIPQDGIRGVIGKVFDNIYSSGERDRYRTRLERSKDGVNTEIYITHYGMEEVLSADKISTKWQARANDPEIEAAVLQRLMVRFGGSEVQPIAGAATTGAATTTGAAKRTGTATLQGIFDGSVIILMSDAFDKSWHKIGLAIERTGLAVEDKDRAKGIYFLSPAKAESGLLDKMQFWKESKNDSTRYRVNIKDGITSCEVSVTDQNGAGDGAAKQIIEAIFKNINQ